MSDVGEPSAEPTGQELAQIIFANSTRDDTLDLVAVLAHKNLPSCIAASVTVADRGKMHTAVSSAKLAAVLDEVQYEARQGPCLDAIRQRDVIEVEDFAAEGRWPPFTERVRQTEVASSLSLPLFVADEAVGALNLYSGARKGLHEHRDAASSFAAAAAVTLANALAFHRAAELSQHLAVALESRDVIGQAKGMLMAREGLSADEAFDRLRELSQHSNRKLHEIALEIVAPAD